MGNYDEEIDMICNASRVKMILNGHKGSIENVPLNRLRDYAAMEMEELLEAFDKGDWDQVIIEAGDCMNFLIGMVRQAKHNYRNRDNADKPRSKKSNPDITERSREAAKTIGSRTEGI